MRPSACQYPHTAFLAIRGACLYRIMIGILRKQAGKEKKEDIRGQVISGSINEDLANPIFSWSKFYLVSMAKMIEKACGIDTDYWVRPGSSVIKVRLEIVSCPFQS